MQPVDEGHLSSVPQGVWIVGNFSRHLALVQLKPLVEVQEGLDAGVRVNEKNTIRLEN